MSRHYDPCDGSRVVKWRWRIAGWLNRMPRTCWADIVSWALGSRRLIDRHGDGDDGVRRQPRCFQPGDERCYCGKFANPLAVRPTPDTEEAAMVESSESPAVGRG